MALSNYVARLLITNQSVNVDKISVCSFPTPITASTYANMYLSSKKILLIGRGKKYQGQHLLEEAWNPIDKSDKNLVIAGKGFKPSSQQSDIEYKNWWTTTKEVLSEIASSDLVVFPYIEALQSGIIPIRGALSKPVVVTPVGGLIEQVDNRVTGLISVETNPSCLPNPIVDAMNIIWNFENIHEKSFEYDLNQRCLQKGK
jgi:glycosyltransferase involved in cell wall biosynthesis